MGTRHVAEASRRVGAHILYVSTDYVFDGTLDRPYVEWDATNPQSVYGRSKLGGEHEVAAVSGGDATVVRTAWVSGAHGANMVKTVLRLATGPGDGPLRFVDDQHGTPTFTADLASTIVGLALDRRPGTFHVTNQGETTWFGFARATLSAAGLDPERVEPIATGDLDPPRPAPRPANSRLDNAALRLSGLALLPKWTESLTRLVGVLPAVAERG
jgi:dTDP-4-dehydrorhamnose reductase